MPVTTCSACNAPLSRSAIDRGCKTGMCAPCYHASIRKPRACIECNVPLARVGAKRCQPCNNRFLATDKDREARRMKNAMQARFAPEAVARHRRAIERNRERAVGWCPVEHRREYENLRSRIGAAAARLEIMGRLSPFERQLALVRSGRARIIEVPRIPTRGFEQSLTGNSAAMMAAA